MSVIAIDTASRHRSLVLRCTADGTVLDHRDLPGGALDRRLAGAITELLAADVAAVVVLTGPGSYSGVRAGMAAALGVADARALPLHGLGNLAAVAEAASVADGGFGVVADAGRGGVYVAAFERQGATTVQVSSVRRVDMAQLAGGRRFFASEPLAGPAVETVDAIAALARAVPVALASPPLTAGALTATHAVSDDDGGPVQAAVIGPATR